MAPQQIKAPFTPEQVKALNEFQESGMFHPFTCGSAERCVETVKVGKDEFEVSTTLKATKDGWICPNCSYTQDWAWDFMANTQMMEAFKSGAYL